MRLTKTLTAAVSCTGLELFARSRFIAIAAGAAVSLATLASATAGTDIGLIELDGKIHDRGHNTLMPFGGGKGDMHIRDLTAALARATKDAAMKGVVIRLRDVQLSRSNIDELGKAMDHARAGGKKIHVIADNYGPGELMLACHADEIIIQQGGAVMVPGVYMEEMFLADALKWVGISPDFVQVGDYKGASEMMANSKPSKAWDENINGLLDSMYGRMRSEIKSGRKLDDAKLDKALETAWMASDMDAKAAGLIDTIIDLPDLEEHLSKSYGGKIDWNSGLLPSHEGAGMAEMNPFTMLSTLMAKPSYEPKRDTIAVLHIDGAIIDGDSSSGGLFGGGTSVGCRTIRRALEEIRSNPKIKGVVVRIDSPGGSAIASEVIWQGLQRVSKGDSTGEDASPAKPVFASVGSMAASGGYYIAVGSSQIYVNDGSIVGSIGVVGGKLAMGGLFEKLHINTVARARGPRAAMFSSSAPWSDKDKALVRQKMTETYDQFTSRVTAGRPGIDLKKTAEGRLFLGENAVKLKMADKVGSFDDAINDMAAKLKLADGGYDVMDYPAPKSLPEMIEDLMGAFGASASGPRVEQPSILAGIAGDLRRVLGESAARSVSVSVEALLQMRREPVILMSPSVLIFK